VLAEHQRILRDAFEAAGGQEIDTQGDSFFVAFPRAKDAVSAAVAGQRALVAHRWPKGAAVRVRMALHTGEPAVGDERYVGMGVRKAARIAAAAHGGQILLSNTTRGLVEDELPLDARLVDLGEHELKDIDLPERIFQLTAAGLPHRFSPLRLEAPLPRSRVWRHPARVSRERALLSAAAGVVLAAVVVGLALAMSRHETERAAPSTHGSTASRPTTPVNDPDAIIPGKSIGAVAVGMTEAEVKRRYGSGSESQWLARGRNGTRVTYSGPGGALTVNFYDGKVVQVATTNSYYSTANGISVGSMTPNREGREPGVDVWRGFLYEGHLSYCLRGEKAATQLIQAPLSARVGSIFVTDARFLAYLPAHVDPNPYTGGEDFFCSTKPLEP
jgi:hypothetical protein